LLFFLDDCLELLKLLLYLKQAASHGKDPPNHLHGVTGAGQEGQPAEGKGHQHRQGNSHQQQKPASQKYRYTIDNEEIGRKIQNRREPEVYTTVQKFGVIQTISCLPLTLTRLEIMINI